MPARGRPGVGYNRQWERQARAFLAQYFWCGARPGGQRPVMSRCHEQGIHRLATQVDHVIPHNGNAQLFDDMTGNCQALCDRCHARKTRAEGIR